MKVLKIISLALCVLSLILMFLGILTIFDNDDGLIGWLFTSIGMLCIAFNIGLVIATFFEKQGD